ncbi:MAG: DNA polymerase I [Deltaproteobacteria bacterium]|nr:MAG: DNA polymerase I [Deltaproteobacteria bacterium]
MNHTSNENDQTLYLIDGTAYIYRAYHAIRNLSNSRGFPTNAIFGFTRMLIKFIDERSPRYAVMFFDAKGPTFRHQLYDAYKANRPPMPEDMVPQIPYIKKVTAGFNLPILEMPGFEADDLIGTVARQAEKNGFSVVMVTGDKDFMQIVTEKTTLWDPMKEKTIDIHTIQRDFGLKPTQIIDMMGLSGDTADNIPGVPGIGPKTAQKLIQAHTSMEQLYEEIDTLKSKKKLYANLLKFKDQAFLSKQLVTIDTTVDLPFQVETYRIPSPNRKALGDLFQELEFRQLQQQFTESAPPVKKKYTAILDETALDHLIGQMEKASVFALDTETTSINPMAAELVGVSVALAPDEAFYIPCGHDYPDAPEQLPLSRVIQRLKPILEDPGIGKIGQNIKYDWTVLQRHGIRLNGVVFDTMVASYLINPSKRAHNLDQIAMDYLNHKTITYKEVVGKDKSGAGFKSVDLERATPYACEDADVTLMAKNILEPRLKELGLVSLFETVEIPLIDVLRRMEMRGVCVDRRQLLTLSDTFQRELQSLEIKIHREAGESFNIKSSQQLGRILFEKLNLPFQKKTRKRTGYSTDVEVLTALSDRHPVPNLVLRYRTLSKLKSTYTDALIDLVHPETGRIHTSYNQTVTATGRLSSSDPNLQNIPIRSEEGRQIRSAFVPKEGWVFLSADYSQIELRLLAHCSDDEILISSFLNNEDIHRRTASEVFHVPPEAVTNELRSQAKVINFGIIYGMGAFSLAKELKITNKMAATYIDNYFARYRGVKQFIDDTIATVRSTRQTETLLGRIRLLPEIDSRNRNIRSFAERTAVNTPIQGSAADLIKLAMIQTENELQRQGLKTAMLLSVHDEIVFEVPPDELEQARSLVTSIMEGVWDLKVPLKVNLAVGKNWAEAH